ncbi:MAG: FAD-dependent oxidoreductase [Anaerolineales bacterium]|nr:FAD-dependent oxidoreductase [Anaerolineales bacterium]
MMRDDVLIIGGGIIGVSAAYYLARAGVAVTIIEKGDIAAGSSYGNAGLLCPCHSTPIAAPGVLTQGLKWLLDAESPFYIKPRLDSDLIAWLWRFRSYCNQSSFDTAVPLIRDLQRASLDLYRELIDQEKLVCNFEQHGGLALYRTERGFEHGQHEAAHMNRFGLQMAVLDAAAARALEPAIHPDIIGAVRFEEDAHITPHLFVQGLARAAQAHGAAILTQTEILGFDVEDGLITAVNTTRGRKEVGQVVLAAGVWSTPIARDLGIDLPMQPAKGYSITVKRPRLSPRRYLYLGEARVAVTPMGEHLRFAGTLELAGFDFKINRRRVNAILRAADAYLAEGSDREVVEIWRGMRPCSPDGLPYIGRARRCKNLVVGTGHATLGMSMGPITGKLLAELVGEKRPSLPLHSFNIERFDSR